MKQGVKAISLLLLCMLWYACSIAQTIKGTVKDTAGKALPYVTVSAKSRTGNTIVAYTVTDSKGGFVLSVPARMTADSLLLEARSFGYQSITTYPVNLDTRVDFVLPEAVNQLQEVVVKSSLPVLRTHGDTLSYKVSEFASPQDRKIGEVIRKMPGITVATDGTIRYNNKPVSTVYIGGDNLLDDKYSIATNTIPQGVVNRVEVIQNDQPIKALQNKVMSDDVALNLVFKKEARLHLIGQESIGLGLPGNYDVDLNAMLFRNNYKAINYLGGNNTGFNVQRALVSHNLGDYLQRVDNATPAPLLSSGEINNPGLAENRYLSDKAGVINLNNLINLKNDLQLRVNAYYVHDRQQQDYKQQTTIFLPGDTVRYSEVQQNRSIPDIFHTQFTLNVNRASYYLNDVLLMDVNSTSKYSNLTTDSAAVNQVLKSQAQNFSNELNLIRTLHSNRMIQVYSYISHSAGPENLTISPGYNAAIFNNNLPYSQLVQQVHIPSWYANHYFAFRIPSGLVTQSYRAGFSVQAQTLSSELNVVQNNNSSKLQSDSAWNQLHWTRQKLYAEAGYDLTGSLMKAKLTLPVTLQQISYAGRLYPEDKNLTRLYFNPQLNMKYQVSAENYVSLQYSYRNQIGTIEDIYPGYILTNYRTLYANNASLTEQQVQQVGGGFSYRKAIHLFFWSVNALYSHTAANNISASVITNNIQRGVVLPYPNSMDTWSCSGFISKYVFPLRTTFSGSLQWMSSHSVQIQNSVLLPFNTVSEAVNINADTKISNWVNCSYKASLSRIYSQSPVDVSAHRINQFLQQLSVEYNPVDALQCNVSGEHYFTRQQGNPDLQYFFADASMKFRARRWKTDFELSAVNLLNTKTYQALYLSANTFTASSYTLPGRIILLKVLFNI